MLKSVRDMISAQKQCMEAASLILEAGKSLDDIIVLGEAAPGPVPPPTDETEPIDPAAENPDDAGDPEPGGDPDAVPSEEPLGDPEGSEGGEEPLPVPGADDLPEPIGKQTGEPPISADDDLLNMQVNLGSNTLRDVLPQPPANAADAIGDEDDIMKTRVDAGFGGDEGDAGGKDDFVDPATPPVPQSDVPADPAGGPEAAPGPDDSTPVDNGAEGGPEGAPVPPVEEESGDLLSAPMSESSGGTKKVTGTAKENIAAGLEDKIKNCNNQVKLSDLDDDGAKKDGKSFSEAITMDDGGAQQPAADPSAQPAAGGDDGITEPPVDTGTPAEGGDTATDTAAEEPAPENDVTAAVKDKVAEVTGPTPGTSTTTEDLLNKLSNVTKNIEDIKKGLVASGIGTMNV